MQWFISIVAGIAVGLAWLAIWNVIVLHAFGIAVIRRQAEDRAGRRERMRQMGKLRYILMFGVLGSGLGFGLSLTTIDLLDHRWHGWVLGIAKLVLLSVFFGWFNGASTWSQGVPVPFPPDYPPAK